MRLIISDVKGGIGNQFFIFFFSKYFVKEYNGILLFKINSYSTAFSKNYNVNLELEKLVRVTKTNTFFGRIFGKLAKLNTKKYLFLPVLVNEQNFLSVNWGKYPFIYLTGHWIHADYFNLYKEEVRVFLNNILYNIENRFYFDNIISANSVSIHIRGKQYITAPTLLKTFKIITKKYYLQAIEIIKKRIKDPVFFVFSNDPDYAKSLFESNDNLIHIKEGNSDIEDLLLMSHCKHNIITNSTFSWWAAALNNNSDKIIICPMNWLNDPINNLINRNLIMKEWIAINN